MRSIFTGITQITGFSDPLHARGTGTDRRWITRARRRGSGKPVICVIPVIGLGPASPAELVEQVLVTRAWPPLPVAAGWSRLDLNRLPPLGADTMRRLLENHQVRGASSSQHRFILSRPRVPPGGGEWPVGLAGRRRAPPAATGARPAGRCPAPLHRCGTPADPAGGDREAVMAVAVGQR
jgi:hypothetical protein